MKLLINNKYADVGFWSFLKCNWFTWVVIVGLIYGSFFIIAFLLTLSGIEI
jgi:hypothetical protein